MTKPQQSNPPFQKPMMAVLNAQSCDSIPFWFMRQAGRYLPEYRKLRAEKGGFLDMALDPRSACEITMQPVRRFGMDAAIIFSDILVIPHALGQSLEFVQGEGPKLGDLDITRLSDREFSKLDPVFEALANVRTALRREGFSHTALIGFSGAPWTVATYMVEGGSSRDFLKTKMMAYKNPEAFGELVDILVEATAAYLIRQVQAGAEILQIFDSWAGALDDSSFRRWVIEPTRRIVERVRAVHPGVPIIGFPKGAGQAYMAYAQESGVNALGLDSQVSTKWAGQVLQPLVPLQGNLDPVILLVGGEVMISSAKKILEDLKSGPFVFNLGHGIHKDTPVEQVEELAGFLRDYG